MLILMKLMMRLVDWSKRILNNSLETKMFILFVCLLSPPLNRNWKSWKILSQTLWRLFISCCRTRKRERCFSRSDILNTTINILKVVSDNGRFY